MADNTQLLPGGGGDTMRDIDRAGAGIKTQVVQLDIGGPAGNAESLVTGSLPISAAALPLPAGAATAAKQPALGTAGAASADVISIQGEAGMTAVKVDGSAVTQPVSGTVTANQGSPPWTWDLVKVNGVAVSLGQKAMAASIPMVLASDQAAIPVTANAGTNLNTSALALDATLSARLGTLGQKAMAASTPVVIASDQSAVPISGTVTTTPPANASTNVAQFGGSNVATGTGVGGAGIPRVTVSSDSFPAFVLDATFTGRINTQGQKAMAASTPVVLASDQSSIPVAASQSGAPWQENITQFGGSAVVTGTGISGAGIPRVTVSSDSFPATQAVNLTQVGGVAISEGQKAMAASLPVAIASDQNAAVTNTGTFTGSGQTLGPFTLNGASRVNITFSGTYAGLTVIYEVSSDGVIWEGLRTVRTNNFSDAVTGLPLGTNATLTSSGDVGGRVSFRVRSTAFTSGTANVVIALSTTGATYVSAAVVGQVGAATAFGNFIPVTMSGVDGGALVRTLSTDTAGQLNVNQGTPGASAWPVSAAALPLPAGAATESGNLASIQFALQRLIDLQTMTLAVLQAMHAQDGNLSGQSIDPSNFLSDNTLQ